MQTLQNKPELLSTVVEAELVELPGLMEAIRQAVADADAGALRMATHTLKGSLRYFGKTAAFEGVLRLEAMAKEENLTDACGNVGGPRAGDPADVLMPCWITSTRAPLES